MKFPKLIYIGLIFLFAACDEETNPYPEEIFNNNCNPINNDTIYYLDDSSQRKILLEDFTGQQCTNCPTATEIAKNILNDYPEDIILVGLHNSGPFSEQDISNGFPLDLETETGAHLITQYPFRGFPIALINRSMIENSHLIGYSMWENAITQLIQDAAYRTKRFSVELDIVINTECNMLTIYPTVESLTILEGDYYMVGYLLEDGIIGKQLDSRVDSGYIENYVHNHVLRKGFPAGGEGKLLFQNPVEGTIYQSLQDADAISTSISPEWVINNTSVVFFIRELESGEILSAHQISLN